MTALLAFVLGASLVWDPVTEDINGQPEEVVGAECEIRTSDGSARLSGFAVGSQMCDLGLLGTGLLPGRYLSRVRVVDGAGNWSAWSEPIVLGFFIRADGNSDGQVDIADPIFALRVLFEGSQEARCLDALDVNDDGAVDVADPIRLLVTMFGTAPPIPEPFPAVGVDVTADSLGCWQ